MYAARLPNARCHAVARWALDELAWLGYAGGRGFVAETDYRLEAKNTIEFAACVLRWLARCNAMRRRPHARLTPRVSVRVP
jgi:hypothetical protein